MSLTNKTYKFSIIIPTYNRAADLDRCLNSLADQSFNDFEVIVCDDGSIDHTSQIVDRYINKLNLVYIRSDNWGGPARPRNMGIAAANTEWLCFLDSDDWYTNNRLEYLSKLDLDNYDLIYHDLTIVKDGIPGKAIKSRQLKNNAYHDLLFNLNAIPTSSTCVRKSAIVEAGGFSLNKEIVGLEDFDLWMKIAMKGVRAKYLPVTLGYYAIGNDNITFKDERQIQRFKALYAMYLQTLKTFNEKRKTSGALDYQIAYVYTQGNQTGKALPFLMRSFLKGSISIKIKSIYKFFICIL
ncbi:glycosyltransferase family 2 protein [Mucilaginibacter sp. McL0603]|uniref:glycosyltransferase family 2 protein n=1 Tax=Mucilaginibacter sp. McL0603 TaxID=3415670 RepID=UPI003CFB1E0E